MKRRLIRLSILAAGLLIGAALAEVILRLAGVEYPLYPRVENPMKPFMEEPAFVEDSRLFWVKEGYQQTLALAHKRRPPLVLLGDSCTEDGRYVNALAQEVSRRRQGISPGYVNLAVGAYSTFQGLRQLERDVVPLKPRVATLYFGWNDHWINNNVTDEQAAELLERPLLGARSLRLVQLLYRVLGTARSLEEAEAKPRLRVPLESFRHNLEAMVELAQKNGITPVLLTAPTTHEPDQRQPPPGRQAPPDLKGTVHLRYVEAVRAVAREREVPLCDLHREIAALPQAERPNYFTGDGIHLSHKGGRLVARLLADCLDRASLLAQLTNR